jgi:hypothetical protein
MAQVQTAEIHADATLRGRPLSGREDAHAAITALDPEPPILRRAAAHADYRSGQGPAERAARSGDADSPPINALTRAWAVRLHWAMLVLLAFIAFESMLLAAAMKGPWLVLFAPGVVCAVRAVEMWRDLQGAGEQPLMK